MHHRWGPGPAFAPTRSQETAALLQHWTALLWLSKERSLGEQEEGTWAELSIALALLGTTQNERRGTLLP